MEFETREIDDIIIYDIKWKFKIIDDMPVVLHQDVKRQLNRGRKSFIFNLKDVEYLESLGLGEIIGSFNSICGREGRLILTNLTQKIRILFETTGLEKIFEIFQDEDAAIKNFSA